MNNSVLSLLFSPKGKISGKEYLAAMILLAIATMVWLQGISINVLRTYLTATLSSSDYLILMQQMSGFGTSWALSLIPGVFILSWTPVALGIKRGAALGFPRWLGVLCGIGLIFLFRPLISVLWIVQTKSLPEHFLNEMSRPYGNMMIIIAVAGFIIGLASCLVLGLKKGKGQGPLDTEIFKNSSLSRYGFIIRNGQVMLVNLAVAFLVFLALLLVSQGFTRIGNLKTTLVVLRFFFGLYSLGLFIYLLYLLAKRFRGTRLPAWPFILAEVLAVVIAAAATVLAVLLKSWAMMLAMQGLIDLTILAGQGIFVTALLLPEISHESGTVPVPAE